MSEQLMREACGCVWSARTSTWWSDCPAHRSWIRRGQACAHLNRIINGGALARAASTETQQ